MRRAAACAGPSLLRLVRSTGQPERPLQGESCYSNSPKSGDLGHLPFVLAGKKQKQEQLRIPQVRLSLWIPPLRLLEVRHIVVHGKDILEVLFVGKDVDHPGKDHG